MARPGVQVTVRDSVPPRSQPTDVDTWFVVGITERGPDSPTLVRSMAEFERIFGERVNYGATLWDSMDVYFREGGAKAYVARVVGPDAAAATRNLSDADAPSVTVDAVNPGDWGETYDVAVVVSGGGIRIQIWDRDTNLLVEQSPVFTTKADLLLWQSSYVTLSDADPVQGIPVAAGRAQLTGGDDDLAAVTDTQYTDALDSLHSGLGAGQVSIPGTQDADLQAALLAHAAEHNRVAMIDIPDSNVVATLTAAAATLRADVNARYGGFFGPRATVPGIIPNTTREVPYSAVQAGITARLGSSTEPAAGANGQARYALSVKYDFSDAEREELNEAGVNIARNMFNGVRTYGYRTLVDPIDYPDWIQLNGVRTMMAIKAEAEQIAEEYAFKNIDGRGINFGKFGGSLMGMLIPYYERAQIYGATPQEAFYVDTGPAVNTPETIADGQTRAVIAVRTSPFGELVVIDIVKRPLPEFVGQALA